MNLNGEQMDVIRQYAMELMSYALPYQQGTDKYKEVVEATGWKKTPGNPGTTCGFLCHWMMWKLGVKNTDILNWNDTTRRTKFETGKNVDKIWHKGQVPFRQIADPYDRRMPDLNLGLLGMKNLMVNFLELATLNGAIGGPRAGDIVMIKDPAKVNSEHVFVFCSAKRVPETGAKRPGLAQRQAVNKASSSTDNTVLQWYNAESGQEHGTDGKFKTRELILSGDVQGYTRITSGDPIDWALKIVFGWLDLGQLDYDEKVFQQIMARPVRV
jgi:hypothetical protein